MLLDMDIDALHSTLLSITLVTDKLRAARENLSQNGENRIHVEELLSQSETDLRLAKATLAAELGFQLCPRCWPPELIAIGRDRKLNCPVCGHISFEEAA